MYAHNSHQTNVFVEHVNMMHFARGSASYSGTASNIRGVGMKRSKSKKSAAKSEKTVQQHVHAHSKSRNDTQASDQRSSAPVANATGLLPLQQMQQMHQIQQTQTSKSKPPENAMSVLASLFANAGLMSTMPMMHQQQQQQQQQQQIKAFPYSISNSSSSAGLSANANSSVMPRFMHSTPTSRLPMSLSALGVQNLPKTIEEAKRQSAVLSVRERAVAHKQAMEKLQQHPLMKERVASQQALRQKQTDVSHVRAAQDVNDDDDPVERTRKWLNTAEKLRMLAQNADRMTPEQRTRIDASLRLAQIRERLQQELDSKQDSAESLKDALRETAATYGLPVPQDLAPGDVRIIDTFAAQGQTQPRAKERLADITLGDQDLSVDHPSRMQLEHKTSDYIEQMKAKLEEARRKIMNVNRVRAVKDKTSVCDVDQSQDRVIAAGCANTGECCDDVEPVEQQKNECERRPTSSQSSKHSEVEPEDTLASQVMHLRRMPSSGLSNGNAPVRPASDGHLSLQMSTSTYQASTVANADAHFPESMDSKDTSVSELMYEPTIKPPNSMDHGYLLHEGEVNDTFKVTDKIPISVSEMPECNWEELGLGCAADVMHGSSSEQVHNGDAHSQRQDASNKVKSGAVSGSDGDDNEDESSGDDIEIEEVVDELETNTDATNSEALRSESTQRRSRRAARAPDGSEVRVVHLRTPAAKIAHRMSQTSVEQLASDVINAKSASARKSRQQLLAQAIVSSTHTSIAKLSVDELKSMCVALGTEYTRPKSTSVANIIEIAQSLSKSPS